MENFESLIKGLKKFMKDQWCELVENIKELKKVEVDHQSNIVKLFTEKFKWLPEKVRKEHLDFLIEKVLFMKNKIGQWAEYLLSWDPFYDIFTSVFKNKEGHKEHISNLYNDLIKLRDTILSTVSANEELTKDEISWLNAHTWKDEDWDMYIYNDKCSLLKAQKSIAFTKLKLNIDLNSCNYKLWSGKDLKEWTCFIYRELIWKGINSISFIETYWIKTDDWPTVFTNVFIDNVSDVSSDTSIFPYILWAWVKNVNLFDNKDKDCLVIIN